MIKKSAGKMKFSAFDADSFEKTCVAWRDEATKGYGFPSDIEQRLEWARSHLAHVDGDAAAYGIFREGSTAALGICEVVVTRHGQKSTWVKLIQLNLRPSLDDKLYNSDISAMSDAISIYGAALSGVVGLKMTHQASTVKVFARTKPQLSFLQQMVLTLRRFSDKYRIEIEGRFLVIANKEK